MPTHKTPHYRAPMFDHGWQAVVAADEAFTRAKLAHTDYLMEAFAHFQNCVRAFEGASTANKLLLDASLGMVTSTGTTVEDILRSPTRKPEQKAFAAAIQHNVRRTLVVQIGYLPNAVAVTRQSRAKT